MKEIKPPRQPATLLVKLGGWFEARATGSGTLALVAIIVLVVAGEIIDALWR